MRVEVRHHCSDFDSYRAARVKSLFNAENGCDWEKVAELPIEGKEWQIGLIVGPSGSGKTSIGSKIFNEPIYDLYSGWDSNKPIIDCIAPDGDFNTVTGMLSAVGLGDVPAWLRPFNVLSNGEKFRAGLARLACERPEHAVRSRKWVRQHSLKLGDVAKVRLSFYPVIMILLNGCSRIGCTILRRHAFTSVTVFGNVQNSSFKFIRSGELYSQDCLNSIII